MNLRDYSTVTERRAALEKHVGVSLSTMGNFGLDEERAATKHCENMIGAVQVPVGVAGPIQLRIKNSELRIKAENVYLPLATTEGALVASINRGCKAITVAGGCFTQVVDVGTSRGPVFETKSLEEAISFSQWLLEHTEELNHKAQETSNHLSLLTIKTDVVGTHVFARFTFSTGDAMGMNIVTIATQHLAQWIEETKNIRCLAVSGNACVDKKPSWTNTILGRGIRAWSEVLLPTSIITDILKTSPQALINTWETKCLLGSALTGSMGFNGHAANIVAALYLATGQDPAHIVEGSQTITTMKPESEGVRISVYLPAVLVGTVGGGTGLATQQEALRLLGCAGGNEGKNKQKLAAIVAAAVLAGEISELAALSSGTLTQAHKKLAR